VTDQPAFGKPFALIRDHDVSGVSGTGHIADGTLFPDGHAVIHWTGATWPTTTPHPGGMQSVLDVHGHDGATRVVWQAIDGPPPADYATAWAELTGYVQQARDDGGQIDPERLLVYMRELRHNALAAGREWINQRTGSPNGGASV
jgi:hypothetical protein